MSKRGIPILRFPDAASFDRLWKSDLVTVDKQTDSEREIITQQLVITPDVIKRLIADYGVIVAFGHKKDITPFSLELLPYGSIKKMESFSAEFGIEFVNLL